MLQAPTMTPTQLDPYPDAWYALAASRDLAPGEVQAHTLCGEEVVLYRTESGVVHASQAHCPHLGAHLGRGGVVVGENLRCPFHGFEFGKDGSCRKAYGKSTKTGRGRLKQLQVLDRNGWILVWSGQSEPGWAPEALDMADWSPVHVHDWTLTSHPQEISENSVDVGYFTAVHGFSKVQELEAAHTKGPLLQATYAMERPNPFHRRLAPIRTTFTARVWGLGYSQVDIHVKNYDLRTRLFVLPQPIEGNQVRLRVAMSTLDLRLSRSTQRLSRIPGPIWRRLTGLINKRAGDEAAMDVENDFEIWTHKVWIPRPALASCDGPIGKYRAWCRQFYPQQADVQKVRLVG